MALELRSRASLSFFWSAVALGCCVLAAAAAQKSESFTATASMKTAAGTSASAPVSITINTFATAGEREALLAAIKSGGTAAGRKWLEGRPAAGTLRVGARQVSIKYAFRVPLSSGSLITLAAAEPLYLVGAGAPGAGKAPGFDLTLVLMQVPATGSGTGELSAAAKLRVDDQGAIVTEDFNAAELVRLTDIVRK